MLMSCYKMLGGEKRGAWKGIWAALFISQSTAYCRPGARESTNSISHRYKHGFLSIDTHYINPTTE